MKPRSFNLVMTDTLTAMDNFGKGVWQPTSDLTPRGSIDVYHTVTRERFRILITDYIHTQPPTKEPVS